MTTSVQHYYKAMATPWVLEPKGQTADGMRATLSALAQHATEQCSESLWWFYIGLHDRYVRRFNLPISQRLPGFPSSEVAIEAGFPPLSGWISHHGGMEPTGVDALNKSAYTLPSIFLLYALDGEKKEMLDNMACPAPHRWPAPVWVFALSKGTGVWPKLINYVCFLNNKNEAHAPLVSRLDKAWAPEASWQWMCATQGPLREVVSDEIAVAALNELRFSPDITATYRTQMEGYFQNQYPHLATLTSLAFALGGPLVLPNSESVAPCMLPEMEHTV